MSVESPPEWLPDGWTTEIRETRHEKYTYYKCLASGCNFLTKEEVLRYLNNVKDGSCISETSMVSDERKEQVVQEVKKNPDWLPSGWLLEIKTRASGKTAGKVYKCYLNPLNGSKFYSKNEVLQFLGLGKVKRRTTKKKKQCNGKMEKVQKRASKEKKQFNRNSTDNVIAHIKHSLDGLPCGSVEATNFRASKEVAVKDDSSLSSVKELESPQDPKRCRFGEEILDLNRRLTEKRSSPDALLPTPSSPDAGSNGANFSINLMRRMSSSGKILETTRCDWNSDAKLTKKLEKAKKESKSIKQQKKTGRSSSKFTDLPLVGAVKSAVDKASLKEQTKPMPAANLNGKSNGGDQDGRETETLSSNIALPPKPEKPRHGKRKERATNSATPIHRRSSRRLAGVAADPVTDWDVRERALRSRPNNRSPRRSKKAIEAGEAAAPVAARLSSTEWSELAAASPFGDSWPDPCIEFAFKTLTGDLPVMGEAMAIQEYFQQQLLPVESSSQGEKTEACPGAGALKLPVQQDLGEMNPLVKT